jgi:hypothetical protein
MASALLGLFLFSHCVPHPGHDDHQGRSCAICHVWSLPFVASPAIQVEAAMSAGVWNPPAAAPAPSCGVWLARPNRAPPSSHLDCC